MTTVLICGGDSWANRGDDAILAGTLAGLRSLPGDLRPVVASGAPDLTARRHGVAVVDRRRPGDLLRALSAADLLLWGGGQLLQNESSRPFLWAHLALLEAAFSAGVPVMGFAQGIGSVHGAPERLLAERALARIQRFTVRDARSAAALRSLGMPADRIEVTADPALLVTPAPLERAGAILAALEAPPRFVVVALRRWGHYRGGLLPVRLSRYVTWPHGQQCREAGFIEDMAAALDRLCNRTGLGVLFVPMCPGGDQDDDLLAEAVRQQMRGAARTALLRAGLPASELAAVLGRAELAVGVRMHPLILAALSGVPMVSLSYQGKGRAFLERLGLGRFALDIDHVDPAAFDAALDEAWEERAAIREQIGDALPELQALAERNFAVMGEMLGARAKERAEGRSPQHWPDRDSVESDESWRRGAWHAPGPPPPPAPPPGPLPAAPTATSNVRHRPSPDVPFGPGEAAAWASLSETRPDRRSALLPGLLAATVRQRADRCLSLAAAQPGETALDLGCGAGATTAHLATKGARAVGLDSSAAMLALARQREGPCWARAGAAALPLRDGCLDVAICAGVLEYLPPAALAAALKELRRALRPGGRLVVSLTERHWLRRLRTALPGWVPRPLRALGPVYDHLPGFERRLAAAGFCVVEQERFRTPPLGVATVIFLARREN